MLLSPDFQSFSTHAATLLRTIIVVLVIDQYRKPH